MTGAPVGATLPPGLTGPRRDNLLYFGTQTAVWQFSDGVRLGDWQPGLGAENEYAVIEWIHDYLVGNATDQPEPKAGLTIDPATASATAGAKAARSRSAARPARSRSRPRTAAPSTRPAGR